MDCLSYARATDILKLVGVIDKPCSTFGDSKTFISRHAIDVTVCHAYAWVLAKRVFMTHVEVPVQRIERTRIIAVSFLVAVCA